MARPEKLGHDYFPFFTSREDRTKLNIIQASKGNDGFVVILMTECLIRGNRSNGYYIKCDLDMSARLHNECGGIKIEKIQDILEFAIENEYFDKKLYQKYKILTNRQIQEDHLLSSQRRSNFSIKKEYMILKLPEVKELGIKKKIVLEDGFYTWLIDNNNSVNVDNNFINVDNNSINADNNTQIKINKIKENEITSNSDCNCKGNSEGKVNVKNEDSPHSSFDYSKLHTALVSFIKNKIFPDDPLEVEAMNNFLFELQTPVDKGGYGYSSGEVKDASRKVKKTLLGKNREELEDIRDMFDYLSAAIIESLKNNRKEG